jgi:hypothetical protein
MKFLASFFENVFSGDVHNKKASTLMDRFFTKGFGYVLTACACLVALGSAASGAPFEINSSAGLFAPSFRGGSNTTWFGWGPGTFDGAPNDELIDSPAPSLGTTTAGVSFSQLDANDYLSGSNNIYSGGFSLNLAIGVPTDGTAGTGLTTIIVQGRTIFGGYPTGDNGNDLTFGAVSGVNATYVQGTNTAAQGQFFAKYEIPGNAASYTVNIPASASPVSIAELQVDTLWSASSFAGDTAIVPEPATMLLMVIGFIPLARKWSLSKARQSSQVVRVSS